jgi:ABC-2 type transport system ATP-binding protein
MDTIVEVNNVGKTYEPSPAWLKLLLRSSVSEPIHALKNVSLTVDGGRIVAVVGPNGAGKSTLFRVLTGLTTPTTGSATILGYDVTSESAAVRRHLGFMPPEERTLWMRHSCAENLIFHGRLQGMGTKRLMRRVDEVLEVVGLAHARDRVVFALSSGMNARLRLARSLLHSPSVVILDEPTGTLDPVGAHEMLTVIQKVTAEFNMAVLMSSHRMEDIEALHDNVLMLSSGHVAYWGNLDELRATWEKPQIEVIFQTVDQAAAGAEALRSLPGVNGVNHDQDHVYVATELRIGDLLGRLAGQVGGITKVETTRRPLRELLADMLTNTEDQVAR